MTEQEYHSLLKTENEQLRALVDEAACTLEFLSMGYRRVTASKIRTWQKNHPRIRWEGASHENL